MTRYTGRHRDRAARALYAAAHRHPARTYVPAHRRRSPATARVARATLPAAAAVAATAALGGLWTDAPVVPAAQPPLTPQVDAQPIGGLVGFAASPAVAPLDVRVSLGPVASQTPATVGAVLPTPPPGGASGALPDIPSVPPRALAAYVAAARRADLTHPACHLSWDVLAGVGDVESGHARSGGSASPTWDGVARPAILGPVLDGSQGFAAVPDTDHGRLDGNATWDRAVGPMQFLPGTWARYGVAIHHAGAPDPERIDDAAAAAADYLCTASTQLDEPAGLVRAVYAYNHSFDYVRLVLSVAAHYRGVDPAALGVAGLPADPVRPAPSPTPSATPTPTSLPVPTRTFARLPSATPTATAGTGHPAPPTSAPSPSTTPNSSTPAGGAEPAGSPKPAATPGSASPSPAPSSSAPSSAPASPSPAASPSPGPR